ncbi:MAG: hypothetical protein ACI9WU_004784 [Myxococcota bacterium]|jgi:hypothetical protein
MSGSESSWEKNLIDELQSRSFSAATATSPSLDPVHAAFIAIVQTFRASIQRLATALGATVEGRGDETDERIRWTYATRALSVRYDGSTGRVFVNADVGTDLISDELVVVAAVLSDQRGRPVAVDELTQRFVTLLFRGP